MTKGNSNSHFGNNGSFDLDLTPIDAAYMVTLEMVKAGVFNGLGDPGVAFISAFDKIKARFERLSHE